MNSTRLFSALLLLPAMAFAHPGHSAFDSTSGWHSGHEAEVVAVLTVAALAGLWAGARWLSKRRR